MNNGLRIFLQRHHWLLCYFFLPHTALGCGTWGWDAENPISPLSVCILFGSANLKNRRRERELAPRYLSAVFAVVTPVGLSQLLCTPASSCPSDAAALARPHLSSASDSSPRVPLLSAEDPGLAPPQKCASWVPQPLSDSRPVNPSSSLRSPAPGVEPAS